MNRQITAILLVITSTLLVVWDIFVAFNEKKNDTISELLRDISTYVLTLPLLLGIVMGHLFWNSERKRNLEPLIWLTLFAAVRDFAQIPVFLGANLLVFALGVIAGAYYWPQKPGVQHVSG